MPTERGLFVVLDGIDGSGKRTQSELLKESRRNAGREVLLLSFPRYEETFFGKLLKEALAGKYGNFVDLDPHIASPLYASDRWESKNLIEEALLEGCDVVCDRWVSANQIHQGGKIPDVEKRKEFLTWLDHLEYGVLGLPRPDTTVFLDVPVEVSLRLMSEKSKDSVENNLLYLENSLESARWLATHRSTEWTWVKCSIDVTGVMRSREDIHLEIVEKVAPI